MRPSDLFAILSRRRANYRAVFETPAGRFVLADLARFCGVARQIAVPDDPYSTYFADGQRRVYLRIAAVLGMTDQELLALAGEDQESPHAEISDD